MLSSKVQVKKMSWNMYQWTADKEALGFLFKREKTIGMIALFKGKLKQNLHKFSQNSLGLHGDLEKIQTEAHLCKVPHMVSNIPSGY